MGKKDVTKSILAGAIVRKRSKDSAVQDEGNGHVGKKTKVDAGGSAEKSDIPKNDSPPKPAQESVLSSLAAYSDDESGSGGDDADD